MVGPWLVMVSRTCSADARALIRISCSWVAVSDGVFEQIIQHASEIFCIPHHWELIRLIEANPIATLGRLWEKFFAQLHEQIGKVKGVDMNTHLLED